MIISSVLSFGFLPSLYECVCSSLRTIWIGLFSRFGEQSLLIGWCSIPLSAHRCLYTHSFFCHSLIFIWIFIYFSLWSSSFVLSPALSLSLCHSFFCLCLHCTVFTALVFLFVCVWEKKWNGFYWLTDISISFSLYSDISDLPFHACKRVCLCVGVCAPLRDAQHQCCVSFSNISNYLTLTKQWNVIYSTRKLQRDLIRETTARPQNEAPDKKRNTVIIFVVKHESLSWNTLFVIVIKSVQFRFYQH